MKRLFGALFAMMLATGPALSARADDKDPTAILDKAIKALGGEEKLKKAEALSWKSKGTIILGGNENEIKVHATAKGLDHYRQEVQGDFGGRTDRPCRECRKRQVLPRTQ